MENRFDSIRETIKKLTEGTISTYEWDDNLGVKCSDPAAEALRQIAWQVTDLFPSSNSKDYCSDKGMHFLKLLIEATSVQKSKM